ncbi:unnamed protein product [Closterium sp. NIES-54]
MPVALGDDYPLPYSLRPFGVASTAPASPILSPLAEPVEGMSAASSPAPMTGSMVVDSAQVSPGVPVPGPTVVAPAPLGAVALAPAAVLAPPHAPVAAPPLAPPVVALHLSTAVPAMWKRLQGRMPLFGMRLMYTQYKLLDLVEGKEKMSEAAELKGVWMKRSFDAYMLMVQVVGGRQLDHIKNLRLGGSFWMCTHRYTLPASCYSRSGCATSSLFDGEPMQPVLDEMRDIFTKLQGGGVVYAELVQCVEIVIQLPRERPREEPREPEKGPKAWAALKGVHAPATAAVAVVLEWQMAALRIEEDEAVEERVQKFYDLLTRLEGADLNNSELQKKTNLLALLPESWSSLIINLNRDLPHLSLEDVKRAILQEDFRRRELASADGAGAASIGRGYGRGRGRGRGGSRFGSNNFNGGRGSGGYGGDNKSYRRGRDRFDGECHYYHKSGHMWRDCFKLPDGWTPAQGEEGRGAGGGRGRGRRGRGGRGGGAASMKSTGNESESRDDRFPGQFFFVSTQASAGPEKDEGFEEPAAVGKVTLHSLDYWVIDSGATYSMTPRVDLLTELEPSPVKHVTSALGQRAEVKGMGKAMFKGADGKMVGLKNVLWVPNLAANLISVRRLQKAGMDTSSKGAKTYTVRLGEHLLWDLHEDRDVYNEMWQIPVVPMPKERQVAASISTKGEAVGSGNSANGRAKEMKSKKCNLGGTSKLGEHKESDATAQKQHKGEENPKAAAEEYGENMWGTIASAAFSNPTSATGECDWLTLHRRMGHVALPILQQLSGRMWSAFKRYKLLKLAMGEEKMPEEGDARDRWIEKSTVLYDLILQSVNNDMFQHIKDLVELDDFGPKAWKLLRDVIQPNMLPMVIVLEKELAALSMRPGDDVKPVLDKIKDTYARMAAAGSNVLQMQQCTKIISVLDNSWDKLIPTLNTQKDHRPEGWAPPGMKPPSGERARGGAVQGSGAQGDGAHGKADPGMFLMVEDVKGSEGDVGSVGKVVMHLLTHWVIDSGCTSHMTPQADLLDKVKPPGKIKFVAAASGALLLVIGVGNGKVMGANGGLVGLRNVLLVEGLSTNLLSVRRLQKSNAKVTFGPMNCHAKLGKSLLWDLEEKSSCIKDLWQLPIIPWNRKLLATTAAAATAKATAGAEETAPSDGALDAVKKVQQPQQPHGEVLAGVSCMGKGLIWECLKVLKVKGAVKEIGSCPTCLETKFTKFPFSSGTGPAKAPLVLLHMDVVGPTRDASLSGSRYFLTIVDDHTRVVWVYPLKTKGEVAAAVLKEWLPRAQREGGHKVKHQLTVPYNPQQSGVAERFNRTLQEGARTLLGRAGLPDPFWVIALRQVAFVKNRVLATVGEKQHKYGPYGELTHYKSRLVAKGFQQTKGKDFDEIVAPVGKGTTLRVMLGTAANRGWRIKQMDITTAFLNGIILEELYMLQPEGLDDGSGRVCGLKKAIYGLKQAPRAWYHKLEETLLAGGFKKSECDHSLFLLQEKEQILMLLVYVDDIFLFSKSSAMIERVEEMLEMQFKCSKMGDVKYYLGMHVERDLDKGVLRLHQRKYCEGLAEKYGLQDGGKPATPLPSGFTVEPCADEEVVDESDWKLFHSMVGALNYAANHTAVRQRQQRGAADLGKGEILLTCYTNASFNSVKADGTSIGGYVCLFGGGAMSWHSKKQNEMGLSSCETEYMALHHGVKEVVWLRRLLEEIGVCQREPTMMFCDNESAVKLAKNACLHGLTKHIWPKWHWVRRLLDKEVRLEIVKTQLLAADIPTKRLAVNDHWKGMKLAGMSVH